MITLCLASTVLAAGCNESAEDGRTVRATIGRSGGQISSHDGVLTLLILPGALDGDHEFVIAPSDTPPLIFGPAYRVQPDLDLSLNAEVTYARTLPNDPTGTAVAAIRRADFEADSANWIKLPTVELDVGNELVTATDTEVSLFYGLLQGDDISGTTSSTTVEPTTAADADGDVDSDTDTGGEETSGETEDTSDGPLSHATDIQPIWEASCLGAGCHSAAQSQPTLEGDGYSAIVGVMPTSAAAPYVTEGDLQLSYLWHKINATHLLEANLGGCGCGGAGSPMPLGAELLDQSARDLIGRWIEEGALP